MTWRVGDVVRLSSAGLRTVRGLQTAEEIKAYRDGSRIVHVEDAGTVPPTLAIDLEGPFGKFLLTSEDVEALS